MKKRTTPYVHPIFAKNTDEEKKKKTITEIILTWAQVTTILVGAFLAVWKFWWEDYYVPSTYPPILLLGTKLEKVGGNDSLNYIQYTFTIKNASKKRVNIGTVAYEIHSVEYTNGSTLDTGTYTLKLPYNDGKDSTEVGEFPTTTEVSGNTSYNVSRVTGLACGTAYDQGWYDPESETSRTILVPIPKRYSTIEAISYCYYSNKHFPAKLIKRFVSRACQFFTYFTQKNSISRFDKELRKESDSLASAYGFVNDDSRTTLLIK